MRCGVARGIDEQVFRPGREAELRPRQRLHRLHVAGLAARLQERRRQLGIGRLVAEAAGAIDRTQQDLEEVQDAAGVEAVGMSGDAAHGVHADRPADHLLMPAAEPVGPGNVERHLLLERRMRQLGRDPANGRRCNSRLLLRPLGRILGREKALGHELEDRNRLALVGETEAARQRQALILAKRAHQLARRLVEAERIAGVVAREQAVVLRTGIPDHQPWRIGVARQVVEIDLLRLQQLVHQRRGEQPVGAGLDADPLIGDRVVARAHRVDGDDLHAPLLELAEADLDRVGGMILGHAEQHEIARVIPVGIAELPERAAERIEAGRRHVHRAEAPVRRIVGRPELHGPPAGQRLALVAAGEERELPGVGLAHIAQPLHGERGRLIPGNFLELARAARADPQQRLPQPRRRIVLHDAGRALAAQHALVHRVIAVAVDVADLAVLQVHANAAAAGAHVAGGGLDLVGRRLRQRYFRFRRGGQHEPLVSWSSWAQDRSCAWLRRRLAYAQA